MDSRNISRNNTCQKKLPEYLQRCASSTQSHNNINSINIRRNINNNTRCHKDMNNSMRLHPQLLYESILRENSTFVVTSSALQKRHFSPQLLSKLLRLILWLYGNSNRTNTKSTSVLPSNRNVATPTSYCSSISMSLNLFQEIVIDTSKTTE